MAPVEPRGPRRRAQRSAVPDVFPSSEARLKDLRRWGGFTSSLTPAHSAAARDCGVTPIGQVVGISMGEALFGWVQTTHGAQGRQRLGAPRWRELTGPVHVWSTVRRRALGRLSAQAKLLDADAVVEIKARRDESRSESLGMVFTGTAVRVERWRRSADDEPVLTLATAPELWAMLRAGVEPVGVAGAFAGVETTASLSTRIGNVPPNVELDDLTTAIYEARRLALGRLVRDAEGLQADGLLNVDFDHLHRSGGTLPGLHTTVHLLATAFRRRRAALRTPKTVMRLGSHVGAGT